MNLLDLQLENFRNFKGAAVRFSTGANLILGRNGQGKTNLLEAIYLLGYGKSYRTACARDCVRHGEAEAVATGIVRHAEIQRRLQIQITHKQKRLFVHGKEAPLDEFAGQMHVLAFAQNHLAVIRGAPAERRAFLDRAMITLYPGHVRHLANYVRALRHRNRLLGGSDALRKGAPGERELDSWDEALVSAGARVLHSRLRYVERLKQELPARLFGGEEITVRYTHAAGETAAEVEPLEAKLRENIRAARDSDRRLGFSSVGPHRDELKIFIDGRPAGTYGSAGQQRSALLSLYFAQMELHHQSHGFYPVFLVDDVEAELDHPRLTAFLKFLAERTQAFLTTAKEAALPKLPFPAARYCIEQGVIGCDQISEV